MLLIFFLRVIFSQGVVGSELCSVFIAIIMLFILFGTETCSELLQPFSEGFTEIFPLLTQWKSSKHSA